MKVVSVNVGLPREVEWQGKTISTGIYKKPVNERIQVKELNLDGDGQADLTVHGGTHMAVYIYPANHYDYWKAEMPDVDFPYGVFGENLTIDGLEESDIRVGDKFRIGTAEVVVTQPRLPCFKLGIRFGDQAMVKRFMDSRRTGFYVRVMQEGEVGPGDSVELLHRNPDRIRMMDVVNLYASDKDNVALLKQAVISTEMAPTWTEHFQQHLDSIESAS